MADVTSAGWDFDATDLLESEIVAVLRGRDDGGFTDEDELQQWLRDAGADFDDRQFGLALGHLARLGRLRSPRPEEWVGPGPVLPGWLSHWCISRKRKVPSCFGHAGRDGADESPGQEWNLPAPLVALSA
jgi:hypothetical protein